MVNFSVDCKTKKFDLESRLLKKYASNKQSLVTISTEAPKKCSAGENKLLLQGNRNLQQDLSLTSNKLLTEKKIGTLQNENLKSGAKYTHCLANPKLSAKNLLGKTTLTQNNLLTQNKSSLLLNCNLTTQPLLRSKNLGRNLSSQILDSKRSLSSKSLLGTKLVSSKITKPNHRSKKQAIALAVKQRRDDFDTSISESLELKGITANDIKFPSPSEIRDSTSAQNTRTYGQSVDLKIRLLSLATQSIINSPNWFNESDSTRCEIKTLIQEISRVDPEFVLKVALYTRCKLNIRAAANFILALGAFYFDCRIYLKKYYQVAIKLPSDWTQVAEFYQSISGNTGSLQLPTALRKVMVKKFLDFDEHQIGKYNKSSGKSDAKKKKMKAMKKTKNASKGSTITENEAPSPKVPRYTLKYLVQKLHIADPAYIVMGLIGKKYPDQNQFYRSRLPGTWESDKVGVRMKLAVPETWETMVSLHGNKAKVWEDLIDHRKLPFMAMLRNLRNLIKAGISEEHHKIILKLLKSEKAVSNSKQFPYRFFSAFEVIQDMDAEYGMHTTRYETYNSKGLAAVLPEAEKDTLRKMKQRPFGVKDIVSEEEKKVRRKQQQFHKKYKNPLPYTQALLTDYKRALNVSIKISTEQNIIPISGRTVIICDVNPQRMKKLCASAKGLGKPKELYEIGCLLGLMCMYSCESSVFKLFQDNTEHRDVELELGGILDNLNSVVALVNAFEKNNDRVSEFIPLEYLKSVILQGKIFDNMIVITSSFSERQTKTFTNFIEKYRHRVNNKACFYEVNLASKRSSLENTAVIPFYFKLHGFSDQILQYIALKDQFAQLREVYKIDKSYNLTEVTVNRNKKINAVPLIHQPEICFKPWKKVKVFISSTFKDTQAERDQLIHNVFPALKKIAAKRNIHLCEIDLRWGVLKQDELYQNVIACLKEVKKCDIFIGILGRRYGWIPKRNLAIAEGEFTWLVDKPTDRSITELEMEQAMRDNKPCYFFIRDENVYKNIPQKYFNVYQEINKVNIKLLKELKAKILQSGHFVFEYRCEWDEDASKLCKMDMFGDNVYTQVLENLQSGHFTGHMAPLSGFLQVKCMTKLMTELQQANVGSGKVIVISGKTGCGKTTILQYVQSYIRAGPDSIIIAEGFDKSKTALHLLQNICKKLSCQLGDLESHRDGNFLKLVQHFKQLLAEVSKYKKCIYIILDSFELINPRHGRVEWIPINLPVPVTILMSCLSFSESHKALKHLNGTEIKFVNIPALGFQDRRNLVDFQLKPYSKSLENDFWNNQMRELLLKQDSSNPLYIISACDYLRKFGTFENLSELIRQLPKTLDMLLEYQIHKVDSLFGDKSNMVLMICALILASGEFSLKVSSVVEILTSFDSCINASLVYTVLHLLDSFLTEKLIMGEECIGFGNYIHVQIASKLCTENMLKKAHALLANYYIKGIGFEYANDPGDMYVVSSALGRLPHHLAKSHNYVKLEILLLNVNFIFTKFKLQIENQLRKDYELYFLNMENLERPVNHHVTEAFNFINRHFSVLTKTPGMIFQLSLDEPKESFVRSWATDNVNALENLLDGFLLLQCLTSIKPTSHVKSTHLSKDRDHPTAISRYISDMFFVGMSSGKVLTFDGKSGTVTSEWMTHHSGITQVKYNTGYLVASSSSGHISLWDTAKQKLIFSVLGHTKRVNDFVFVPIEQNKMFRSFASVSQDRTLKMWNCSEDSKYIRSVKTDSIIANSIDHHPMLPRVVLAMWDGTLRIWDMNTYKRLAVLRGHKHSVSSVKYSSCGTYIASCSVFEKFVYLWSALHGTTVGKFIDNSVSNPRSITFNDQLLTAFGQGYTRSSMHSIVTWKSYLGVKECDFKLINERGHVLCTTLIKGSDMFAVGLHSGSVVIFETEVPVPKYSEDIHSAMVTCIGNINIDQKPLIISGSADCTLRIVVQSVKFNSFTRSDLILFGHEDGILSLSCGNTWIASGSKDCSVCLWSVESIYTAIKARMSCLAPTFHLRHHEAPVSCLDFNPSGDNFISCCRNGRLVFWKIPTTGTVPNTASKSPSQRCFKPFDIKENAHLDWITCCSWSDAGDLFATGSNDSTVKLWSSAKFLQKSPKFKCENIIRLEHSVSSLKFRKGCLLIANGEGNTFEFWSQSGYQITKLNTKQRANDCKFIFDDTKFTEELVLDFDNLGNIETQDWSVMADQANWEENHNKQIPAKKTKSKALKQKMEDFKAITVGNDSEISIWRPLIGKKSFEVDETKAQVTGITWNTADIVSVSEDGNIDTWKKDVIEEKSFSLNSKINCIYKINDACFVAGYESGHICLWKNGQVIEKRKAHDIAITYIFMSIDGTDPNIFITGDKPSHFVRWKFEDGVVPTLCKTFSADTHLHLEYPIGSFSWFVGFISEDSNMNRFTDKGHIYEDDYEDDLSKSCRLTVGEFITCGTKINLSSSETIFALGDSVGNFHNRSNKLKLHEDGITSIVDLEHVFLTSSYDYSIKVWSKETLKQCGFYLCRQPVTSMIKASSNTICCGDVAGNLFMIQLKSLSIL